MTLYPRELIRHPKKCFVETGTETGNGVITALFCGFEKIISIEASQELYDKASKLFKGRDNVKIVFGDSSKVLYDNIKDIREQMTFWLDAHSAYAEDMEGVNLSPVLQEIEQIGRHEQKNHVIMIDDVTYLESIGVTQEALFKKLKEINIDYMIQLVDGHKNSEGETTEKIMLATTEILPLYMEEEENIETFSEFLCFRNRLTK